MTRTAANRFRVGWFAYPGNTRDVRRYSASCHTGTYRVEWRRGQHACYSVEREVPGQPFWISFPEYEPAVCHGWRTIQEVVDWIAAAS